ncbi:chondroitin AC/alginate lyase [Abortiporus biennis]|nr:chondroitin AC/alginate lyase [Abortiporus biennis]
MVRTVQTPTLLLLAGFCLHLAPAVHSFYSYDNDFIDPQYILSKNWSTSTLQAQQTIIEWANEVSNMGPWTVMNKSVTPPSGDKHDYMSWAPYWWPDCSKANNQTELTPEQIWVTCPYVSRDGQFNPDVRTLINDIGAFGDMSDAILYSSLAWAINGNTSYVDNVAKWIKTWFLDPDTLMNPNLNYAQMERGPTGQVGTHTGILDFKSMAKIASGILILRGGKASNWPSDVDSGFTAWMKSYIPWLTSAKIALEEKASTNNHGSFYFNQLASLQILVGDTDGAKQTIQDFFSGIYQNQIKANGDQPLESARTHPYHYRAYNIEAMITNARLGAYLGFDAWNVTTADGATIKSAVDYAMAQPAGSEPADEIYTNVAAIGAIYGDTNGQYSKWLLQNAGQAYVADASFFWNQPLSDNGLVKETASISLAAPSPTGSSAAGSTQNHSGQGSGALALSISSVSRIATVILGAFAVVPSFFALF